MVQVIGILYHVLEESDTPAICDVHRAAFAPEYLNRTIFCSPRVQQYITDIMLDSKTSGENVHEFVGAVVEQELVGYAHFRRLATFWHLNQVAVRPDYQGHGIGRSLVELWHQRALEQGMDMLSLDVDSSNTKTVQWYQSLGLRVVSSSALYEAQITCRPRPGTAGSSRMVELVDWDKSVVTKERYGFVTLQLTLEGRLFRVGWLCNSLRIDDDVPAEVLYEALRLVPDAERLLLVSSPCVRKVRLSNQSWRYVSTTLRMQARTGELWRK